MKHDPIILVEIGGSHSECLLTQMHAIKKQACKIILICTEDIKIRNPVFEQYVHEFFIVNFSGNKLHKKTELKKIYWKIKSSGSKKVVFNTAQGNYVRNLCLYAMFNRVEFFGIVHTTLKFKGSFTQRIISLKIKKYLLLSKHLLSTISQPSGVKIDYFYPIKFPAFNHEIKKEHPIVTIIGGVENRRRDLSGLINMLISSNNIDVSFVFLGKTNQYDDDVINFRKQTDLHGVSNKIISFDDFVPQEVFDAYLQKTDLVLPLVHPNTTSANQYFKNQISGAMSISFGYKIPLLIHDTYKYITEMNNASFYYNEKNFEAALSKALRDCKKKAKEMTADSNYNIQYQEERFTKFIFSNDF